MPPHTPASHRPRRKRKASQLVSASSNGTVLLDADTQREVPAFPLAAFFWPIKGTPVSQWVILSLILMAVGLFRWVTGFWQYSGYQMPPMHGDFEAQRHWMELTVHLPVTHWYYHDLQWWGLDYPPLTAYHSWILGMIGTYIQPEWFALYLSRRSDDPGLKVFMRATVILSEFAIFVPAAVLCIRQLARLHNINSWESAIALTALLMQPATILIDHGHFQYNTVMLGFQLASIASLFAGRRLWSCVFFVCALGFKQMALFYAPAVAAYLAGSCIFPRIKIARFIGMAIVTLASFAALFLPILLGTAFDIYRAIPLPIDAQAPPLLAALPFDILAKAWYRPYIVQLLQATHRIFPFARGLVRRARLWNPQADRLRLDHPISRLTPPDPRSHRPTLRSPLLQAAQTLDPARLLCDRLGLLPLRLPSARKECAAPAAAHDAVARNSRRDEACDPRLGWLCEPPGLLYLVPTVDSRRTADSLRCSYLALGLPARSSAFIPLRLPAICQRRRTALD
jgi:alpha-1,3-glucosyltransferase